MCERGQAVNDNKSAFYSREYDRKIKQTITAIQVNHYLHIGERRIALSKCY